MAVRPAWAGLVALLCFAMGLAACDTSLEAPVGDLGDGDTGTTLPDTSGMPDVDGTGAPDDTGDTSNIPTDGDTGEGPTGDTDTPISDDTGDDPTDTIEPTIIEGINACGGLGTLRFQGAPAEPSDRCGDLGEGVLVCSGTRALRCVDQAPRNACGTRGILPVELGSPCGCGGEWVCGSGGAPVCSASHGPNECGGCAELAGTPGEVCVPESGASGPVSIWVCEGPDTVRCIENALNACEIQVPALTWQGSPASPGQPCDTLCGPGVLRCSDGAEPLECVPTGDTPPTNPCGGCGPLPAALGEACGCFNSGTWECDGDSMRCAGSVPRDVCGACTGSAVELGRRCDIVPNGIWLCEGPALACVEPIDPATSNACGGAGELSAAPGDACGDCLAGIWECTSRDSVSCETHEDHARNSCGGCAPLHGSTGMVCGECGSGQLVCADGGETLLCSGNNPNVLNACGGCSGLQSNPGDACGTCLAYECVGGGLNCLPVSDCSP